MANTRPDAFGQQMRQSQMALATFDTMSEIRENSQQTPSSSRVGANVNPTRPASEVRFVRGGQRLEERGHMVAQIEYLALLKTHQLVNPDTSKQPGLFRLVAIMADMIVTAQTGPLDTSANARACRDFFAEVLDTKDMLSELDMEKTDTSIIQLVLLLLQTLIAIKQPSLNKSPARTRTLTTRYRLDPEWRQHQTGQPTQGAKTQQRDLRNCRDIAQYLVRLLGRRGREQTDGARQAKDMLPGLDLWRRVWSWNVYRLETTRTDPPKDAFWTVRFSVRASLCRLLSVMIQSKLIEKEVF